MSSPAIATTQISSSDPLPKNLSILIFFVAVQDYHHRFGHSMITKKAHVRKQARERRGVRSVGLRGGWGKEPRVFGRWISKKGHGQWILDMAAVSLGEGSMLYHGLARLGAACYAAWRLSSEAIGCCCHGARLAVRRLRRRGCGSARWEGKFIVTTPCT